MKAFRFHAAGVGHVDSVADPEPAAGELLLRPLLSGLCSTDIHAFTTGAVFRPELVPMTMGHEVVGEVVGVRGGDETGDGYADAERRPISVGDQVVVEPLFPCGHCRNCRRGAVNVCRNWSHLGFFAPGSWADLVAVPASRAVAAPAVDPRTAVFVEPLACALNFVDLSGLHAGESALVLGAGPAGLLTVQALRAAGAGPVFVSEPNASRRALATRLGADVVLDPRAGDLEDIMLDRTRGHGPDVIIEVTGVASAAADALDLAPRGSTVVLAGVCGRGERSIDPDTIVLKELSVRGGLASRWHFGRALQLLTSGQVQVDALISGERPWQDVATAMTDLAQRPDLCKVLLTHA